MTDILSSNVRLIDDEGKILNSSVSWMGRNSPLSESSKLPYFPALRDFIESLLNISSVSVEDEGRRAVVVLAKLDTPWRLPNSTSLLVVPCLPLALFVGLTQIGVEDMPLNCLAGDPFLVHRNIFATLDHDRWAEKRKFFVTANAVEVPLRGSGTRSLDKFSMEHNLRVMEGVTCLHTRPAYVRGSSWDIHEQVYRFTPHRGGVQSLCYTPYPDLPLLRIKLMDSYEVAGPEGVSTDPPQVRAELEFTGTIYGTNLTERDTAVITDELCTDFTSQNVFFVELFFSSASRVSFFGTFHKRGHIPCVLPQGRLLLLCARVDPGGGTRDGGGH
ncbi:hypothetical protein ADEAN_000544000 [Angomonas deanei]|uniref:Uncharacterized protein n=1 Tax=Angomonas deanei TaxID=59799 RepID=A0A7G2CGF8_9TRYP|nr:hypothetical protein ADEAN_000544000 [Angomonas deanei]